MTWRGVSNQTCPKGTNTTCSTKLKFTSLNLTFNPKINRGCPRAIGNTCAKYHYFRSKDNRSYCAEMVESLKSKFDLDLWPFDPKINRGHLRVMGNIFVKYHFCMPKENGVIMQIWYKVWSQNLNLTFDLLTPKTNRGLPAAMVNECLKYHHQRLCEVSSMYINRKWSYHAEMVQILMSTNDLNLWTPKSIEVLLWSWSTRVKYHNCIYQEEMEFSCGNHLSIDRRTDRQPCWNQYKPYNFVNDGKYKRRFI